MGRPKIEIDAEQVFKLAELGCRNTEIAKYFNCSPQTLETRFQPELDKGRHELKKTLRRWQLESAKRGNVAMQIWLGKQILHQSDKIDHDVTTRTDHNEEVKALADQIVKLSGIEPAK